MFSWSVTMKLYLTRVNVDRTKKEEANPTIKELDAYMRKGSKYKTYLREMYIYGDYGKLPSKIKYNDGGKLSFELSPTETNYKRQVIFPTTKSVIDDIMDNSIEDGLGGFENESPFYYPTKKKYGGVYEPLCFIGCQKRPNISVKKKLTKLEIKKRTAAIKAVNNLPKNVKRIILGKCVSLK